MSITPVAVAVLLVVGLLVAGVIVVAAGRAGSRSAAAPVFPGPGTAPPITGDLPERVRALCAQNQKIHAIKLIRHQTGLGLKEAKDLAEAIEAGRIPPGLQPGTARPDLASRVRELKAAGRTDQAIFLVRGETGMDQADAEAFINVL